MKNEKVIWNTQDGKEIVVTASLILQKQINADGDIITVDCCEFDLTTTIEAMNYSTTLMPWKRDGLPTGCVAVIGKIVFEQEILDKIETAIAKVKSHAAWQAKMAKQNQVTEKRHKSGYCNKCHTYCYGDCEA